MYNKTKKQKKAQMEMMGLVVIVILITMIFLFALRFNVGKEPSTIRKDFLHSELASNTLSALLKTDSRCDKLSMTELFQDCARDPNGGSIVFCEGGTGNFKSCDAIQQTLGPILQATLTDKGKSYQFTAYSTIWKTAGVSTGNESAGTAISEGSADATEACSEERQRETYPIPLHPGTLFLKLDLCG